MLQHLLSNKHILKDVIGSVCCDRHAVAVVASSNGEAVELEEGRCSPHFAEPFFVLRDWSTTGDRVSR